MGQLWMLFKGLPNDKLPFWSIGFQVLKVTFHRGKTGKSDWILYWAIVGCNLYEQDFPSSSIWVESYSLKKMKTKSVMAHFVE